MSDHLIIDLIGQLPKNSVIRLARKGVSRDDVSKHEAVLRTDSVDGDLELDLAGGWITYRADELDYLDLEQLKNGVYLISDIRGRINESTGNHLIHDLLGKLPDGTKLVLMDDQHMDEPLDVREWEFDEDGTLSILLDGPGQLLHYLEEVLDNFDLEAREDGSYLLTYRNDLQENTVIDGIFEEDASVPLTVVITKQLKEQGKKVLVDLMDDAGPLVSIYPTDDFRHVTIMYADSMESGAQIWTYHAPLQSFDDDFDLHEEEWGTWVLKKL